MKNNNVAFLWINNKNNNHYHVSSEPHFGYYLVEEKIIKMIVFFSFAFRNSHHWGKLIGSSGRCTKCHGKEKNKVSLAPRVDKREAIASHWGSISENVINRLCSHCQLSFCFCTLLINFFPNFYTCSLSFPLIYFHLLITTHCSFPVCFPETGTKY